MNVERLMTSPPITVRDDATLEDVARTMLEHRVGGVTVVDAAGSLVGIISERDFMAEESALPSSIVRAPRLFGNWLRSGGIEEAYEKARSIRASTIMTASPVTVEEGASVDEVINLMIRHEVDRIPVVRDGKPVGIFARRNILQLLIDRDLARDADDAARGRD